MEKRMYNRLNVALVLTKALQCKAYDTAHTNMMNAKVKAAAAKDAK